MKYSYKKCILEDRYEKMFFFGGDIIKASYGQLTSSERTQQIK